MPHLRKPGMYSLAVKPQRKQAGAVMDVHQVRLVPLESASNPTSEARQILQARQVVFLGDIIAYGGDYVGLVEIWFRMHFPAANVEFLDLALPSETVSGLSEPGHAGGAFPRLDLHERLGRLLEDAWLTQVGHTRPGMNQGRPLPEAQSVAEKMEAQLRPLAELQFPGKRSLWYGFDRYDFDHDGKPVFVVAPRQTAPGRPWLWEGEFFGHKPNPDLALLGRGFHVVYLSVPDMLGCPEAVGRWTALHTSPARKTARA